jgi:hypothetical protein
MKKLIFMLGMGLGTLTAISQTGIGVNVGFTKYPETESSFLTYGAHGMFGAIKDSKWDARLMFSTGAEKYDFSVSAAAIDDATTPSFISVDVEAKFRYTMLSLDALYNFGQGSMEDGGLYAGMGLGLGLGSFKYTAESYSNDYSLSLADKETASQIYFRGIFGYSYVLDNGIGIFGEGFLNLPPNSNGDGEAIDINLYGSFGLNFGVRKHF